MKKLFWYLLPLLLVLLSLATPATAQFSSGTAYRITSGDALPATCNAGPGVTDVFIKTAATQGIYFCSATDTWTNAGTGGGGSGCTVIGPTGALQYNDGAGACTGVAALTFNGTDTLQVGVAGSVVGKVLLRNATSGSVTIQPTTGALGSAVWTVLAGTDTFVGLTSTQTLTNKTLTAPVLTAPVLGTPASGTLTNATGLPISTGVSGLGTGVATALAVNIGSAGAPVLFNGAGGTPSSLTLTNATGLPPTTGIVGWPANASGCLNNNGSGTYSYVACSGGGGSQTPWTSAIDSDGFPLRFDDGTGIQSTESGNPSLLLFTSETGGVNYFGLTNSATATTPKNIFQVTGSDSNVSLHIRTKQGTYPNVGQVFFDSSVRYDRPSIAFYDVSNTAYAPNVGIGMKGGGSWLSLIAPNIMLGAGDGTPGLVGITGNSYLAWNVNNTAAEDCPACVAVGFNKPAQRVIGVVGADSTPDGDLTNGATFGFIATTPSQLTADQNDYDPTYTSYFQRWSSDASRTVTGLTFAISTKVSGQMHRIWNVGSNNIVLANESASSKAANRFTVSTGADLTLGANECADAQYDAATSRWRVTPCATAGGGSGTVTSIATTSPITGGTITTTGTIGCATCVTSAAALTSNLPVIGGGGQATSVGTVQGNTTKFITYAGSAPATNDCAKFDANGNITTQGAACGGGGGGSPGGSSGDIQTNDGAGGFGASNLNFASSAVTQTLTSLGTTLTESFKQTNSTAATSGNQQVSPAFVQEGQGYKTNSVAASQSVKAAHYVLPVQGTANPSGLWKFAFSINGGAYGSDVLQLSSAGQVLTPLGTQAAPGLVIGQSVTSTGFYGNGTRLQISIANVVGPLFNGAGMYSKASGIIGWDSSSDPANNSTDSGVGRNAAGRLEINNGTAATYRDLIVRQYYADQTITAGGTTGNQTINKSAGTVNVAAAGTAVTVTNSLVTTSSTIHVSTRTNDTTCYVKNVVPASGSFTINLVAACTAETSFGFLVVN